MERAIKIDEKSYGVDHPRVANSLNNLAQLLKATNRLKEAEPLMERALRIDEKSYGMDHPTVARDLNNLAMLFTVTNRLKEAEPVLKRVVDILINFSVATGHAHPHLENVVGNYADLLDTMGWSTEQIMEQLRKMGLSV
jgi:tetratricopeptide (TPR) repeat protein